MSHKYNPSTMHAGLLIYSVDGQTDFILNDIMLRIKTGDILIHQIHHALTGQDDIYRDLIRTLFGTHRINLIGLVFTFGGSGQFSNCMRWSPVSSKHMLPIHPTEQKLIELALISLYMNDAWLEMPLALHRDVETLSESAKKQYLLKLGEIERLFIQRQEERQELNYSSIPRLLKLNYNHSPDDFQSFQWTPNRIQLFDSTMRLLLDEFYNVILQAFKDGEFDPDQYVYYNDSTRNLFSNFANSYGQSRIKSARNYYVP